MDLTLITVSDFKALFYRDFSYLPSYDDAALYNSGDRVYYNTTKLFYDCLVNGTTGILPTAVLNWSVVSDDISNYIQDADIERAFIEAQVNLNQGLYSGDDVVELAYLYLTAHYLSHDIKASAGGVSGQAQFPVNSKSVGSVSVGYAIPTAYTDNPVLSFYTSSTYGMKFLSITLPAMVGNVAAVGGATLA